MNKVKIITGATASGKSTLALELAIAENGIIINADSMQIYKELPILTACPSESDRTKISHKLYNILDGNTPCNAAYWAELAATEIKQAWKAKKLPIITGGTGMYIKCLMEGIAEIPKISTNIKQNMRAKLTKIGNLEFYKYLISLDPLAEKLNFNDGQRMLRAAEIIEQTGKSLYIWQKSRHKKFLPEAQFELFVVNIKREILYDKINNRFKFMLENGALEEVAQLITKKFPQNLPIMNACGVPEIIAYLQGKITLDKVIIEGSKTTRHYAKRQLTWIRNQFIDIADYD